ncbi:MAG TPA: aminoglycoside phosphotransferase family protein [Chitinophagaceae bacterium]|jgi:Ser/Thr protein kinase RdoA (MazF antagonist)|nr:aminoglycoside phosphotransferase family protein [Chitinophagaceae bacterium]
MNTIVTETVLPAYGLAEDVLEVNPYGSGLINHTWSIQAHQGRFILQRINDVVFPEPRNIEHNINVITRYLKREHPDYCIAVPIRALDGKEMIYNEEAGFFRLFPFIAGSHSKNVVDTAEQAYEAALQFGRFTRLLAGLDVRTLKETIPFFHDLNLRYQQFLQALKYGNQERVRSSRDLINQLLAYEDIVKEYKHIKGSGAFQLRVTHHDTKISNVLFDQNNKGICVIDLDTVMPGYFISDVGDMMRTYLCPVSEEEEDYSKIGIRDDIFKAIAEGYNEEMREELSHSEQHHFIYAGKFMIYMQALRFLADYLNDDAYYGASYEGHNLVRAGNQAALLERLIEKERALGHTF